MNIDDWLEQNVYQTANLSNDERRAIEQFVLIWSLYERRVLNSRASPGKIAELADKSNFTIEQFENKYGQSFKYIQDRYTSDSCVNSKFEALRFPDGKDKQLVRSVFENRGDGVKSDFLALLLVIYRLRNNLIHGEKWAYGIQDQMHNFQHASMVLIETMEWHKRPNE